METKLRVNPKSNRVLEQLICAWCHNDKFIIYAEDNGIIAQCDCGYGISFNFFIDQGVVGRIIAEAEK